MKQYDYPRDIPGVDPLSGQVTDPDAYLNWIAEEIVGGGYLLGVHIEDGRVIDNDTGCVVGSAEPADDEAYVQLVRIPRLLC